MPAHPTTEPDPAPRPDPAVDAAATPKQPSPFARVPEALRPALERRGFTSLTKVQTAALDVADAACDLQISSQTGSGKTVALGFVMARTLIDSVGANWNSRDRRGPGAIVIVPTRELAAQVSAELAWLFADIRGIAVDNVTGGTNIAQERRRLSQSPRVLVGTPGRLLDHIKKGVVDCAEVRQLVLDEADQMLDMGFREELEAILAAMPEERRTHLLSATFPPAVRKLVDRYQTAPVHIEGTTLGAANDDIEHIAHLIHAGDRYAALINLLLLADGDRTLVFVPTRVEAAQVSERLARDGFTALPLSGELQQAQRTRTLAAFKAGAVTTLVATDVAARGLDVPDVSLVIHSDTPQDAAAYTHRSGRTGRAGNKGRSVLLVPMRAERRVKRVALDAGVELAWHDVPTAAKVRKLLGKRARRRIHARLATATATTATTASTASIEATAATETEAPTEAKPPTESQLDFARSLLQDRKPENVVAALVAMVEPDHPMEPADLEVPESKTSPGKGSSPKLRADRRVQHDRPEALRRDRPKSGHARAGLDFERFSINWGERRGANPKRLLALICRRGNISSRMVGAIVVGPFASTVEVACDVARSFEIAARKRDSRDPQLRITPNERPSTRPSTSPSSRAGKPPHQKSARAGG